MNRSSVKLGKHSFVTKLAGFEHSKFIQFNATRDGGDIPMIQGKNIRNGKVSNSFDWYISKEISNALPRSVLDKRCIVIPYVGSKLGELAIFENDFKCHLASNVAKVELIDDFIDLDYLYYYLTSKYGQSQLFRDKQGSAQPNITMEAIRDTRVVLFEKKTQQQIASVLSSLDDKINLNNKINAELEAMAKMLYDYWFVQFDFPNAEGKPYKSTSGEMVYDEVLKREIPKGWEVKSFSDFISKDKSGDWGKEEAEGNYKIKVECIRGTDINGINGKGEVKAPVRYILEKNEHKVLQAGDLIVEISGGSPTQSTGRLAYITQEVIERFKNPLICSNFCKAVALKKENQYFYFIYSWNKAYDNGILFGFEGKTSGIKNLLFESLVDNYKVAKPSDDLLDKFEKIVSSYEKKKQLNLRQNQELASLRDWLLPMLINGQVKVKDAQEIVATKMEVEQV